MNQQKQKERRPNLPMLYSPDEKMSAMAGLLQQVSQWSCEDSGGYPDDVRCVPGFIFVATADGNAEPWARICSQVRAAKWYEDVWAYLETHGNNILD